MSERGVGRASPHTQDVVYDLRDACVFEMILRLLIQEKIKLEGRFFLLYIIQKGLIKGISSNKLNYVVFTE